MIYTLTYISTAVNLFDNTEINSVLDAVKEQNKILDVSGFLVYKEGTYLQLLEGDKEVVSKLYEKIRSDERHKNVLTLQQSQVSQRVFNDYESGFLVPNNTNLIFDLNSYLKYLRLLEDKEVNQIIPIVESIYSKM